MSGLRPFYCPVELRFCVRSYSDISVRFSPIFAISPNLNTSPGYNFYGNDTFEKYLSKSELKKIKENYDLEKKEYDECAKNKSNENCIKPTAKNIENTKYYDIFRLYSTNSGILQYMTNVHIDNIIDEINKK